jgi:M6 family metalloprotease-like protein
MTIRSVIFSAGTILLCSASALIAQEIDSVASLRALNNQVLRHHEFAVSASDSQAAGIRAQAAVDIERREAALASLIETDPNAALKLAFSADLIHSLQAAFPASASHLEQTQTLTGWLQTAIEDSPDLRSGKLVHRMIAGGRSLEVYFSSALPATGSGEITIEGVQAAGKIAVRSFRPAAVSVQSAATGSGTTGAQKIVTVLVNLPAYKLPAGVTADVMKGVLYGNSYSSSQSTPNWSVDDFWQQNSDGLTSAPAASGQVIGPYSLASNYNTDSTGASACNYAAMEQDVINAVQSTVNFQSFNRVVIVMPNNGACTWAGVSSIGYWGATSNAGAFTASFHWLRADTITSRATGVQLAGHELGHGMGLNHARTRAYPGPPAQALGAINAAGTIVEYGDPFGIMSSWNLGFYSAMHAEEILGWLGATNYIQVQTTGQYTINAYETRNATGLVKALRVLRDAASNSWLWIEFHTNTGNYDSQVPSQVWSGALIHYEDASTGIYTNLLDFTPSATNVFTDAALAAGQTWTDPYTNLSITAGAISPTSTGSTLGVTVNYGVPSCVSASPTVLLSPLNPTVSAGGSTSLTMTVKSNNAAACPASSYSLATTQPSGFTGNLSATSLTLAGGASGSVTIAETAGTATGTFAVSATATDTSTPKDIGTGTANITVAASCTLANPTVTVSPGADSLAAGASAALTITLKNNNSSTCAAASFNLTAVQPAGFSGTFSATSLNGLASGASGSVTLTETFGSTTGTFTLSITGASAATPSSQGTGTASLTVVTCALAAPVVSLSPPTSSIKPAGATSLTISVSNRDSGACTATAFTVTAVQPTGFTGKLAVASLTIAPGATSTTTLTENAGRIAGTYAVSVSASSGSYTGSATATLTVSASPSGRTVAIPGAPSL